jgi:acetyl esterase/lipase
MTCVIALKLRDENGPRLAVQVPLFPEAAFPAGTVAASENRSGLYLESNGIFEMVRNLVKNTDDVRHTYLTPLNAESHAGHYSRPCPAGSIEECPAPGTAKPRDGHSL